MGFGILNPNAGYAILTSSAPSPENSDIAKLVLYPGAPEVTRMLDADKCCGACLRAWKNSEELGDKRPEISKAIRWRA